MMSQQVFCLKRLRQKNKDWLKKMKIRKTKPLLSIADDEKPFNIPNSWEWVRLSEVVNVKCGKRLTKGEKLVNPKDHEPYIKIADMQE